MFHILHPRALIAILLLALTAPAVLAGAISHVETLSRATAPGASDEQVKSNKPFWANAQYNSLSTVAVATGVDFVGNHVSVIGTSAARADFSSIYANAHGSIGGEGLSGMPAASASGQSAGILQLDWIVTGASGSIGSIFVSGSLFAGGSIDASMLGAGYGSANAALMASLFKDACGGAGCSDYRQVEVDLSGIENIHGAPTVQTDYTLVIPVKPGDHVYLQYVATTIAGGGYGAWTGTTPDLTLPGSSTRAGLAAAGPGADTSFAQRVWLTGGLGLTGTDGLTPLGDGSYGFGAAAAAPEPATGVLLGAALMLLARRRPAVRA